jgi:hypothetical protein
MKTDCNKFYTIDHHNFHVVFIVNILCNKTFIHLFINKVENEHTHYIHHIPLTYREKVVYGLEREKEIVLWVCTWRSEKKWLETNSLVVSNRIKYKINFIHSIATRGVSRPLARQRLEIFNPFLTFDSGSKFAIHVLIFF